MGKCKKGEYIGVSVIGVIGVMGVMGVMLG